MKKKFVVILGEGATEEHHEAFRVYLKSVYPTVGWWHRAPSVWLIIDIYGSAMSARTLRDSIVERFPGVHCLVLEFNKDGNSTWAGFGPTAGALDWFSWLRTEWTDKW